MKTTILNASPRKNGSTSLLLGEFLKEYNGEIAVYNMYELNIKPCIACNFCEKEKRCFNDDTKHLLDDIFSSECVIFASPVYNYSFPAPMKAFLDRLQPYYLNAEETKSRRGFLLLSCGQSGKYSVEISEKQAKTSFAELGAEFCGSFTFNRTDYRSELTDEEKDRLAFLSEKFFANRSSF